MKKYSVIVPVYNRPMEVRELLESLVNQDYRDFELLIIEDGSSLPCEAEVKAYSDRLDIRYFYKPNSGPGRSRNFGMEKATGEYLVFFDSDCLIPPTYFSALEAQLSQRELDAYGGPDNAHESFTDVQKAINYAMTSLFTTGGVRGKKSRLDRFQPRSFNMGFRRSVYQKVGGFADVHPGEDPDLSYRIMNAGFKVGLIEEAYVFHKRRIDFSKFTKQVYKFGMVRAILIKWYPERFRIVYLLPSLFLLGSLLLLSAGLLCSPYFLLPMAVPLLLFFADAWSRTRSIKIALLAVAASILQLYCYGWGFLKVGFSLFVLGRQERKAFPKLFFAER